MGCQHKKKRRKKVIACRKKDSSSEQSTSEIQTSLVLGRSTFGPVSDGSVFGQYPKSKQKSSAFGQKIMFDLRTINIRDPNKNITFSDI